MKIKKYQNPSGTLTPEREAEIRAEQQAALNELWEKRNAYAEQEEQERKQQLKDEIKRITKEVAAKTAHLDNGSSATDWYYALQDDPQKRAEWDRGAKLTTLAGLGAIATPYLLYGMGSMGGAIYRGLNNPITRTAVQKAGTKAALSTLIGEAIDRGSQQTRTAINNSSIGASTLNKYFISPTLATVPWVVDVDGKILKVTDDIGEVAAKNISKTDNLIYDKSVKGKVMDALPAEKVLTVQRKGKSTIQQTYPYIQSGNADEAALHWFDMARQKFGDEVLVEAFPYRGDSARDVYENAMMKQNMFALNGTHMPLSEDEIVSLATARQAGYGNDGLVFARAMGKSEISQAGKNVYTALFEPGIVDKYQIVPRGYTMTGYPNISDYDLVSMERLFEERRKAEELIEEGLRTGDKSKTIAGLRALQYTKGRTPTLLEQYNISTGYKNGRKNNIVDPSKLPPSKQAAYKAAQKVGKDLVARMNSSSYEEALAGESPLIGLTREIEDMPVYRVVEEINDKGKKVKVKKIVNETRGVYPIVAHDAADVLPMPSTNGVMALQKNAEPFEEYVKRVAEIDPHIANEMSRRAKILDLDKATPDAIIKTISPSVEHRWPGLGAGVSHLIPDSTFGLGKVPTMSISDTDEGFFKIIGPASTNTFGLTPGLKRGGNIPIYLKFFKGK